jgi:type III pantothenate kinase
LGAAGQIEALVGAARAELGAPAAPVVATGGLAQALAAATPAVDRVDPWLTLRGLRHWALGVGCGPA